MMLSELKKDDKYWIDTIVGYLYLHEESLFSYLEFLRFILVNRLLDTF